MSDSLRNTIKQVLKEALAKTYKTSEESINEFWSVVNSACDKMGTKPDLSTEEGKTEAYRLIVESYIVTLKVVGREIDPLVAKLIYEFAYSIVNLRALQQENDKSKNDK